MKILMICGYRIIDYQSEAISCGSMMAINNIARALAVSGADVTAITRAPAPKAIGAAAGGKLAIAPYLSPFHLQGDRGALSLSPARCLAATQKAFLGGYDACLVTTPLLFELPALKMSRIPIVYLSFGLPAGVAANLGKIKGIESNLRRAFVSGPLRQLFTLNMRKADKIVVVADSEIDDTASYCGVPKNKIELIYNPVDTSRYKPADSKAAKKQLGLSGKKVILAAGRLSPEKGGEVLLETLPKIIAKVPDALLLLAGINIAVDGSDYNKKLKEIIARNNLSEHVMIATDIPEEKMPLYHQAADIAVAYSTGYDPFINTLQQALAAGLPVVSSYSDPRAKILREKKNVLWARSKEDLAPVIIELLGNSRLASVMSRNNRDLAGMLFALEVIGGKYLNLLRDFNKNT